MQGSNSKPHQPNYQPTNSHTSSTFPTSHSLHPFPPKTLPITAKSTTTATSNQSTQPPTTAPSPGSRFLRSLQTSSTPRAIRQPRRPRRRVSGSLHSTALLHRPVPACLYLAEIDPLRGSFSFSFPSLLFLSSFFFLHSSLSVSQFPRRSGMHMLRGTMQRRIARRDHRRDHP